MNIIHDLQAERKRLSNMIYEKYDIIKKIEIKSSSLHAKYVEIQRFLLNTIRVEKRFLLRQTQIKYDRDVFIKNIERQLRDETILCSTLLKRSSFAFLKRSCIEKTLFHAKFCLFFEKSSNWRMQLINDLIALCDRREHESSTKKDTRNKSLSSMMCEIKRSSQNQIHFFTMRFVSMFVLFKQSESVRKKSSLWLCQSLFSQASRATKSWQAFSIQRRNFLFSFACQL